MHGGYKVIPGYNLRFILLGHARIIQWCTVTQLLRGIKDRSCEALMHSGIVSYTCSRHPSEMMITFHIFAGQTRQMVMN